MPRRGGPTLFPEPPARPAGRCVAPWWSYGERAEAAAAARDVAAGGGGPNAAAVLGACLHLLADADLRRAAGVVAEALAAEPEPVAH